MSHAEACEQIIDHPVPFTCESGLQVCCTISNIESPTLGKWGTCEKTAEEDADEIMVRVCLLLFGTYIFT
jgi:hypothetical protein